MPIPTGADFQRTLKADLQAAQNSGLYSIDIKAGDLHTKVMHAMQANENRMPACCFVMYREMQPCDAIIDAPELGAGPNLCIRYRLRRKI